MNSIFQDIKQSFREGSYLTKLIYINLAIFVIVRLADVVSVLFLSTTINPNRNIDSPLFWLMMPAQFSVFFSKFWTIITYMFLHFEFLHLLFNVLFLYWFGRVFLNFFNEKQLVGVYLLGGIAGGILYLLMFNLLPYYQNSVAGAAMLGASASALAIAVASATAAPHYKIRMLFIGEVRLQYLALAYVLLSLLSITGSNQGGHIAHLGGALAGYLFVKAWENGKDFTQFFTTIINFFINLFRKKPNIKVSFENKRFTTEQDYRDRKAAENQMIDEILDKIKRSGYDSLSKEEKKALFDKSQK